MSNYGSMLKALINFSASKLSHVAELVGYDISYVSKWCNKNTLPATKMAPNINLKLAEHFADEILRHEDLDGFNKRFSVLATPETLKSEINMLLKDAYLADTTKNIAQDTPVSNVEKAYSGPRLLLQSYAIQQFLYYDFPEMLKNTSNSPEILCTLDVCHFLGQNSGYSSSIGPFAAPEGSHIKMGLNMEHFQENAYKNTFDLYSFINNHPNHHLDFYEQKDMRHMQTIVVKDVVAIICSMNQHNRISMATVTTNPKEVDQIYNKIAAYFHPSVCLLHFSKADDFYPSNYYSYFYTKNRYQFFLTYGFEYLLPDECFPHLLDAAKSLDNSHYRIQNIERLQVTWNEIFENGKITFFIPQTAAMRYFENGEILFSDLHYTMTPEERKLHIQHILEVTKRNPNITVYIIDDSFTGSFESPARMSIFNNQGKLFMKLVKNDDPSIPPNFYIFQSDALVKHFSDMFDKLASSTHCRSYDGAGLQELYNSYGSMIERTIDLHS